MAVISSAVFGKTADGKDVTLFTLKNKGGMSVGILDFGCIVQNIVFDGVDVALGLDTVAEYERDKCFFGAFVGRCANRIKGSRFEVGGVEYRLVPNEGENHLHGVLAKTVFSGRDENGELVLTYQSPDGEEGFPGNVDFTVKYALTDDNELVMDYTAVSDKDTVINLTNHSYFNLNGHADGSVLGHGLRIFSDAVTESDADTIATGRLVPVEGTPMDFRETKKVGRDMDCDYPLITMYGGYDNNFVLGDSGEMKIAAVLVGDKSGIGIECYTTQPAVQLYTGNHLGGRGKAGAQYEPHFGICLETQHYPCSTSFPSFPTTVLRAGESLRHTTVYRFFHS